MNNGLPRRFGYAWQDPLVGIEAWMLMPFNYLAGWGRKLYFKLRRGDRELVVNARDYHDGFLAGHERGRDSMHQEMKDRFNRALDNFKRTGRMEDPNDTR